MTNASARRERPDGRRLLSAQAIATALTLLLAAVVAGAEAALSALLGGAICIIANLYFIWRITRSGGGRQARRFVSDLYRAEAGKFGLTVALFAALFATVPPSNPIFFFGAYVAAQFAHWLVPLLIRDRSPPRT